MPPQDPKLAKKATSPAISPVSIREALKASISSISNNTRLPAWIQVADEDHPNNLAVMREAYLTDYRARLAEVKSSHSPRGGRSGLSGHRRRKSKSTTVPRGLFGSVSYTRQRVEIDGENDSSATSASPLSVESTEVDKVGVVAPSRNVAPLSVPTQPPLHKRHANLHKRWGVDNNPDDYWFDARIHTFGNTGFLGGFHAFAAPLATWIIDNAAYDGRSVRTEIAHELRKIVDKTNSRVLDMCCGVGISTRALQVAFDDAEAIVGLDTSPEMLAMAKVQTLQQAASSTFKSALRKAEFGTKAISKFIRGNAERTNFKAKTFDLVTVMYAFHEAPRLGRYKILREVRRLLKPGGTLALVDISPEYEPSPSMLAGEPYVLEYQQNIHQQMEEIRGFTDLEYKVIVPGHVGMWLLKREEQEPWFET